MRQTLGRHVDLPRELLGTTDVKVCLGELADVGLVAGARAVDACARLGNRAERIVGALVEELTREELADGVVFRAGEAEGREFLPTFPKQGLRVGVVAAELIGSCEPEDVDVNLGARDLAQDSDMVVVVGPTCADSSLGPAQREVGGHQSWQPPAIRTSAESSSLDLEEGKEVLGLAVELLGNERDLEDSRKQECRQDPNGGAVAVINAIQLLASEAAGLGEARVEELLGHLLETLYLAGSMFWRGSFVRRCFLLPPMAPSLSASLQSWTRSLLSIR